jgi:hypothetical protein
MAEDTMQKDIVAHNEKINKFISKNLTEKIKGAKTKEFLIHCFGRDNLMKLFIFKDGYGFHFIH